MKPIKLFLLFVIVGFSVESFVAGAQDKEGQSPFQNLEFVRLLQEDITRAGINTHCYEFRPVHDTKAPKGYKPFYISHYGRHGSRSNWGGAVYESLIETLTNAKDEGLLTVSGDSLLNEVIQVNKIHNGMNGRLTRIGCEEHQKIADRMYGRYKKVFKRKGTSIRAISSVVPRCIVSMTAFTSELKAINPKFDISWDCGETYQKYISNDPTEEIWKGVYKIRDSINATYRPDTVQVMQLLFKDPVAARKHVKDVERFERYIFEAGVVTNAFEMKPILRFLPFDAIYKWFDLSNLQLYLGQCNSKDFGSLRVPLAEPLVDDIVSKADEAIAGGNVAVDLRFGHDYPALTLASYLGLEGVGDRLSVDECRNQWFGPFNVPFAVNIQMVFFRNKQKDILVKFLFNEEETLLRGLEPFEGPYYKWDVVRENIKGYLR